MVCRGGGDITVLRASGVHTEGRTAVHRVDPGARRSARGGRAAGCRPAGDPAALTGQEVRVAATAARGGSTRDIAAQLFLAPRTVEFHLGQIYRKLDVRTRAQMIAVLGEAGIGQPADPADGA